ncbi:MAG: hypothetical protein AAF298_00285 [Cyanobacteria bacterium P01_A01_bin.40]
METYTKPDIASLLDTTVRTITEDSRYLTNKGYIKPIQINGSANQYSESDLEILRQLRQHCKGNNNRKTFVLEKKVEVVSKLNSNLAINKRKLTLNKFKHLFEDFSTTDPFYDYVQLQRAADNSWYLPTAKLSIIINKEPDSFSHLQRFTYQGFILDRQPQKEGNSYIWSVNANQ